MQVYDTVTKNLMTPTMRTGETAALTNAQRVAAGCMSGASACMVVFPLETLRTQAAMGHRQMKGAGAYFTLAADIIRCDTRSPIGYPDWSRDDTSVGSTCRT